MNLLYFALSLPCCSRSRVNCKATALTDRQLQCLHLVMIALVSTDQVPVHEADVQWFHAINRIICKRK